ncbi:MAG: M28 family peptidase [Pseudomonadota bacterium]
MLQAAIRGLGACALVFFTLASRCGQEPSLEITGIGKDAMSLTRELVAMGPRPPGSAGIERVRQWIGRKAADRGLAVDTEAFQARTPIGEIEMKNLFALVAGRNGNEQVLLLAHYDSKRFVGMDFVGANDSACAVALLLAMIPSLREARYPFDVRLAFVDGEEALVSWSRRDSLYGSRHLAAALGSQKKTRAVIVLDMIGDADLKLIRSADSDPRLQDIVTDLLRREGREDLLERTPLRVEDDQLPFSEAGIPALHLMDFTYGGRTSPGRFWHTPQDTVDKISDRSLSIVGQLTLGVLGRMSAKAD